MTTALQQQVSKLPDATRMGFVHLRVRDLPRALDFYKGMLGMRVLQQEGNTVTLGADEPIVRLTGDPTAPERPPFATGLYHVAILLPERKHLARILEHFSVFRQPLSGAADHLVSEALYLSDPEGNGIEIYTDRPRDSWTWHEGSVHMTTAMLDIDGLLKEAGDTAWNGMPEGTRVGHVHLMVASAPQTLTFYRDLVGFDLTTAFSTQAVFLSAGGYHHHLGANTWESAGAPPPPAGSAGLVETRILLPTKADVEAAATRLENYGIEREGEDVLLLDPSGIRLRFTTSVT